MRGETTSEALLVRGIFRAGFEQTLVTGASECDRMIRFSAAYTRANGVNLDTLFLFN